MAAETAAAVGLQLECKMCRQQNVDFVTWSLAVMIAHTESEHAMIAITGGRFVCCLPRCSLGKTRFRFWKEHVELCIRSASAGLPVGDDVFECSCGERAFTPDGLLKHINRHLKAKTPITCPYNNCIYRFSDYQNFYRHRKKSHPGEQPVHVQSTRRVPRAAQPPTAAHVDSSSSDDDAIADGGGDERSNDPLEDANATARDMFLVPACDGQEKSPPPWFGSMVFNMDTRQVLLYLSMNATFKVPKRKIQTAFQHLDIFANASATETYPQIFSEILRCNGVDFSAADRIASDLVAAVARHPPHAAFYDSTPTTVSSAYRVEQFLKQNMRYVHPQDIVPVMRMRTGHCPLVKGSGVYVDIEKNLTFFVNNSHVTEFLMQSFRRQRYGNGDAGIGSYLDGENCKRIREEAPEGIYIDICIYADEAEPLNPLGLCVSSPALLARC